MKHYIFLVLLAVAALGACKKKSDRPATTMSVTVNGDSAFTTTNVVTDNQGNGTVYISGISSATNERVDLAITGFTEGAKAYYIDYRGTGGNINGNTGKYTKGSNLTEARTGNIYVTSVTGNTITGSFNLYSNQQTNINGTFTAAKK